MEQKTKAKNMLNIGFWNGYGSKWKLRFKNDANGFEFIVIVSTSDIFIPASFKQYLIAL